MIEKAFRWLGHTGVGQTMREATWGFAIVETVHLLGLALLGGTVIAVGLSAAGLRFGRVGPTEPVRAAWPLLRGALAVMIASGVLLVSSKPVRYYLDDMFRAKMALLAFAIVSTLLLRAVLDHSGPRSPAVRATAFATLSLWLGVGIAGRLIGFL